MEITFCDLRCKEVINIVDGKSLGHIIDLVFETNTARVLGIVVPNERNFFSIFRSNQDIFIPYGRICKIGKDVILVQMSPLVTSALENKNAKTNNKKSANIAEVNTQDNNFYNPNYNYNENADVLDNSQIQ